MMESAPQSTIAHNAVIESASDAGVVPRHHREERGRRIKRRPALPKRAAPNRRGPCQNRTPGATLRPPKTPIFGKGFAWKIVRSARILEKAVGQALERQLPSLRLGESRVRGSPHHPAHPRPRYPPPPS